MKGRIIKVSMAGALLLAAAGSLAAQDYAIEHFSIAGGGGLESASDDGQWVVSGTIGQWEATEARASAGDDQALTGGFWALTLDERLDVLFEDRFEQDNGEG